MFINQIYNNIIFTLHVCQKNLDKQYCGRTSHPPQVKPVRL